MNIESPQKRKQINGGDTHGSWSFTLLDEQTTHVLRSITLPCQSYTFDVTPEQWQFCFVHIHENMLSYKVDDEVLTFPAGRYALFFPSFSITEIGIDTSRLDLEGIISSKELPECAPHCATIFALDDREFPSSYDAIIEQLVSLPPLAEIQRFNSPKSIAEKIKNQIDQRYRDQINLTDIADAVKVPSNLFSMYFKESYYLTPSQYRKQLRLTSSVLQLLQCETTKETISDIAFDCGYGDLSRYNKQFKSFLGITPKKIKNRNK